MHKFLSDMSGCRTLVLLSAFETNSVKLNRNTTISIKKMEFQNGNHFGPCMYVSVFGMCLENDCQPNNWNRKGEVRKVPKKGWERGVWSFWCMKTNAFRTCGSHYGLNIQTRIWIEVKNIARRLGCVRNDSEMHETVLLDCTTCEARCAIQCRVPTWSLFPGKVLTFDHGSLGPGKVLSFSNSSRTSGKSPYFLIKSRLMNWCLM